MASHATRCVECDAPMRDVRIDAKTCSPRCRVAVFRHRQRDLVALLVEQVEARRKGDFVAFAAALDKADRTI